MVKYAQLRAIPTETFLQIRVQIEHFVHPDPEMRKSGRYNYILYRFGTGQGTLLARSYIDDTDRVCIIPANRHSRIADISGSVLNYLAARFSHITLLSATGEVAINHSADTTRARSEQTARTSPVIPI